MTSNNDFENEIKELKKQLKRAERKISTLESDNNMLVSFYKKATIMRDISERELMLAKEKAESAGQAKSDFLASMSHEIRTPINAVLGMNELIMRESTEPQILEYAADIRSSGRMLLSIINDILDFSKIESGKMDIIPVEYDISSMVNDIVNMLRKRAQDKDLDFIVHVEKSLPTILFGDEIRIRQVITNLMTNAIKYTDEGSVTLDISGIKNDDNLDLLIKVIDTGKGIKDEDKEKLFNSFTRVDEKENRTIEGTGLGLALTKGFVDMMGGNLFVESEYGKGSTFGVSLCQKIINDEPVGDIEERIKNSRLSARSDDYDIYAPNCRVLVVDDVEMNCKVICGLLKNSGMVIDSVNSGFSALEKCRENKYDLIFMDHRMPKMDGIECFRELKKMSSPNDDTPVIALTANALSGMREMYINEGFSDYLTKPVEVRKLECSLRNVIPYLLKNRNDKSEENKDAENSDLAMPVEETKDGLDKIYPELDIATGLKYCMDSEEFYREMIKDYASNNRYDLIEKTYHDKNLVDFKTYVHGIKSTSLTIGACQLSAMAKELEKAAGEENIAYIDNNYELFMKEYIALVNHIREVEKL